LTDSRTTAVELTPLDWPPGSGPDYAACATMFRACHLREFETDEPA
jgi:hypothetical protein